MKPILLSQILSLVFLLGSTVQAQDTTTLPVQIESIFQELNHADAPGLSIAVVARGELIFTKGYGSAQLEYQIPINPQTRFHVASVSKQFTAMAIMLLAADDKLDLDDEIHKHLQWLPRFEQPITIRQLVNHTSGIRDQWELLVMAGWRFDDVITMDDIRSMMARQKELNFEPQSDILYSNMGYTLLADIVAEVAGKSFKKFTRERIFEPLGMQHTHFHIDHQELIPGRAYSYERDENKQLKKSVLSYANVGATSLFTTPEDLVLWLDNFRTKKIGTKEVYLNLLAAPKLSNGRPPVLYGAVYAGGLMLKKYRGLDSIGHSGGDAGFRAYVQWFPEYDVGIAIAANFADADTVAYAQQVSDVVLKDKFPEPPAEEGLHSTDSSIQLDVDSLDRYAGMFQTSDGRIFFITTESGKLKAEVPGLGKFSFKPLSETEFLIEELRAKFTYINDDTDLFDDLKIMLPGSELSANRMEPVKLSSETLNSFVGAYYSPELRTQWDIFVDENTLRIHHPRHGDIHLIANPSGSTEGTPTIFNGDQWYASRFNFETDESDNVLGFRVSGERVKGLWFEKL